MGNRVHEFRSSPHKYTGGGAGGRGRASGARMSYIHSGEIHPSQLCAARERMTPLQLATAERDFRLEAK